MKINLTHHYHYYITIVWEYNWEQRRFSILTDALTSLWENPTSEILELSVKKLASFLGSQKYFGSSFGVIPQTFKGSAQESYKTAIMFSWECERGVFVKTGREGE